MRNIIAVPTSFLYAFLEFLERNTDIRWGSHDRPTEYVPQTDRPFVRLYISGCMTYEESGSIWGGDMTPNEYVSMVIANRPRR